ncbi:MAG: phosphoenolpyruvate carboxykinase (GTP), partial [Propionibacteriaceae bacterium]|nr:phosphoenolpyruvate carboxykinase (GTP) [Propionibacteriaceae bacterium]
IGREQLDALFALDPDAWSAEADLTEEYFTQFGDKLPPELLDQLAELRARIAAARE